MNVKLLIQEAYKFAEILAEDGQPATSAQLNTGLSLFNKLLRRTSISGIQIPLTTKEDINLTANQEITVLDGWIKILKAQYNLGSIKFDILLLDTNAYRNASRITSTSGIPYVGYARRTPTGIDLELFFKPSTDYVMTLDGYKNLIQVVIDDNLTGVSLFMQDYLQIQLASDLRDFEQLSENIYLAKQIAMYKSSFTDIKENRIDMISYRQNSTDDMVYTETPWLNLSGGWYS